jgi:hypothetical protein
MPSTSTVLSAACRTEPYWPWRQASCTAPLWFPAHRFLPPRRRYSSGKRASTYGIGVPKTVCSRPRQRKPSAAAETPTVTPPEGDDCGNSARAHIDSGEPDARLNRSRGHGSPSRGWRRHRLLCRRPLTSQDRTWIGRGHTDVPRVRGAHT